MISKELLSEIYGYKDIKGIFEDSDYTYSLCNRELSESERLIVFNAVGFNSYIEINIYELAHKCKEWSLTMGYFIYSTNELAFIKTLSLDTLDIVFSNGDMNECECILKACEWIFKQGENK